jgi:catechol 2,3-dioxygenase-like lactoylglutathione lyase family enzyme
MPVSRVLAAILSDRIADTRDFYVRLLDFKVAFESDFFIELESPSSPSARLGIWQRDHELVPKNFQHAPSGVVLSFGVDDVDAVHLDAERRGLEIVQPLRNESYGQRHFMTVDPNGLLLDVTSPIPMSHEFIATHGLAV